MSRRAANESHWAGGLSAGGLSAIVGLVGLLLAAACASPPPQLSDAGKLARIEGMAADIDRRFADVEHATVEEVGRMLESGGVILVDAREPGERSVSWIPGSITPEEFELDPEGYADRTVVAYCTIGERSSEYARGQAEEGRRVLNLRGSLLSWTHAGGPLVGPDGPTSRLHVYGRTWDLAPDRYETVW